MSRVGPLFLAHLVGIVGCGGEPSTSTDVGNPAKSARLILGLQEGPSVASAEGESQVVSAKIFVRDVALYLAEGQECGGFGLSEGEAVACDPEDPRVVRMDGPVVADLVTELTEPSWAEVSVPPARYERVDVRLATGDALGGKSFSADVSQELQGSEVRVAVRLAFQEIVRFSGPEGGANVAAGEVLWAEMDPAAWLEGEAFEGCVQAGRLVVRQGVVEIDDGDIGRDRCPALEREIRQNIRRSGGLRGGR